MTKFIEAFEEKQVQVHQTALEKGWWEKPRSMAELIALMHSELSEALESERHGRLPDDKIPDFNGVEAEFADVVLRIMDAAEANGLRVAQAIESKMEYNKSRDYRHGGKTI